MQRILLACALALAACSGSIAQPPPAQQPDVVPPSSPAVDAGPAPVADAGADADAGTPEPQHGWYVAEREDFESTALPAPAWSPDAWPNDGPYSDNGSYFRAQNITPPQGFRTSAPFGWLVAESYSRSSQTQFADLASVVADPADPSNHALRIASPHHTDATVVRPAQSLPSRYRVSLRVGFANFGDGKPGLNGYVTGAETAEPWSTASSLGQNGFYWLTILDAQPRPHNNVYIHHHRKVVIDSDNNTPPWMEMFDGTRFFADGEHPVMMIALDGKGQDTDCCGKPFLSYSNGMWQPSGDIRAVDAYLPGEWYTVSIERNGPQYTLQISGKFQYGGQRTYTGTVDAKAACVFHYNQTAAEMDPACAGPDWDAASAYPDWFMFGDPHTNYYLGSVLYDDVQLELWRD